MSLSNTFYRQSVVGITVLICILALFLTQNGRRFELVEFDFLTVVTSPDNIEAPVVVVGIDDASFAEVNKQWPWPRSLHARLVSKLNAAGASVIAFDVVFSEPSSPREDNRFANAIKKAGNVVLASDVAMQERQNYTQVINIDPLNLFLEAGAFAGNAVVPLDPDLIVRKIPNESDSLWKQVLRVYQTRTGQLQQLDLAKSYDGSARYYGPDHSFKYVSYYQALDLETFLPEGIFRDKIVLIGLDTKISPELGLSQADSYATPFLPESNYLMPGVELHATFIANAMLGDSIKELPKFWTIIYTIVIFAISFYLMQNWQPVRSFLQATVIIFSVASIDYWLFLYLNIWLPSVSVMILPLLYYSVRGAGSYLIVRKNSLQIRRAFQHYVPPDLVGEIISKPELLTLGGQQKKITIMFTDLQGFTDISEKLEPESVSSLLIDHLSEMTNIIHEHGGTVDKFIGDAIMAIWGAPLPDEHQETHACKAAIKMQQAAEAMRKKLSEKGLPELRMRIGIHTGNAIVGNLGSTQRFDYTAVGDSVNLASRLENICKYYGVGIIVSEDTVSAVNEIDMLLYIDRVRVKGRETPIEIYTIVKDNIERNTAVEAVNMYRKREWVESKTIWNSLKESADIGMLASIYLERIEDNASRATTDDWDATVSLGKM